jgi:NifU-like protein involved in Fe-S cluster formation
MSCRDAWYSAPPRVTVSDLFERGFRRNRATPLPIVGAELSDTEGNTARFSLAIADERIIDTNFRASSCATLIAYCEFIAELVPGSRLDLAKELTPADLIERVPGVPPLKRDRAVLAVVALRAALLAASALPQSEIGEPVHESRLHLRHPAS